MATQARNAPPGEPVLGAVVIGRNEGERLRRCMNSLAGVDASCAYVDSGSTDGSVNMVRAAGATVVELDMSRPFSAARARNAGFQRLMTDQPGVRYVQFIDGDCELLPAWMPQALQFLEQHPDMAAVCGRRVERHPEASVYNHLCNIEWNSPAGDAKAFGGDVLMRVSALQAVGGYRDSMIAGEEPELAVRLRAAGWRLWRLEQDMTLHDAAMTRWGQWWRRNVRAGHAYAEGAALHGLGPTRHKLAETRRALLWGLALPAITALLTLHSPAWLTLVLLYPAQVLRLALRFRDSAMVDIPWTYACFLVLARFPEAQGVVQYWRDRWRGAAAQIIEYK